MKQSTLEAAIGGLLHDVGKITYRIGSDRRNHSQQGYDALRKKVTNENILNCVKYHHYDLVEKADIPDNSPAYAVYLGDNIAAGADRRNQVDDNLGYDLMHPLTSVFGTMSGRINQLAYPACVFDGQKIISPKKAGDVTVISAHYSKLYEELMGKLSDVEYTEDYVNSILSVMEAYCGYIPSDTAKNHVQDISLYDHIKLTAAFASCINEYCIEYGITDYRSELFDSKNKNKIWKKKLFLMYSCDISGIQSFIYNISSKGALKSLRSRSFALEMLMEHYIDELLECCGLSRANLIYSGGGHCYMILPNTPTVLELCKKNEHTMKRWLMDSFGTSLYMACASQECSANDLTNNPVEDAPYREIYINLSRKLSEQKMHRYTAEDINILNKPYNGDMHRECSICGRSDRLVRAQNSDDYYCTLCDMFIKLGGIITKKDMIMPVTRSKPADGSISWRLPSIHGDVYLSFCTDSISEYIEKHDDIVRIYSKNQSCTGYKYARNIFVGDYVYDKDIEKLSDTGEGIKRLAVCRADVDNLGKAFISGFERPDADTEKEKYRYVTISRTAAFSRQMSMFFRYFINLILEKKSYRLNIVYSGGDDIFLIGNWYDIIDASIAINDKFKEYCSGALTISAGIGIFDAKYPIAAAAERTAVLEDKAKEYVDLSGKEKNAVNLFAPEDMYVFTWDRLKKDVLGEKLKQITRLIDYKKGKDDTSLHGKAMLYKILDLLRDSDKKINIARYAYMLARLQPKDKDDTYQKIYKEFSDNMYNWIFDKNDKNSLIMAIMIYVYINRGK